MRDRWWWINYVVVWPSRTLPLSKILRGKVSKSARLFRVERRLM